jgi:ribosomal protein L4
MKGAQREAEKLAKKYSILGKKVDVQADEPVPVVYLVAVNQLGATEVAVGAMARRPVGEEEASEGMGGRKMTNGEFRMRNE